MRHILLTLLISLVLLTAGQASTVRNSCSDASQFEWQSGSSMGINCPADIQPVVQAALDLLRQDARQVLGSEIYETSRRKASIVLNIEADGRWEGFTMRVTPQRQLVITGSDAHGLAYGILEVSRMLGVSPWSWWADVVPVAQERLTLPVGYEQAEAPDVDFRGIFINDEDWGLMPWSSQTYEPMGVKGSIGPKTYSRVFELLLRLRANTIWPAMHECTEPFFLTPGNREAAARYGIYIGGSHCEPMACSAAVEWGRRGEGDYDYVHNSAAVRRFWEQRLAEVNHQEVLYTIGMRGVHDGAMQGAKTVEEQKAVLTRVIADQREMLARRVNPDLTQVPQVFIPYKEVLDVYDAGLEVPDDVCLMWCDDNYGYVRHFPTDAERMRQGGNGIYYHASYWGRPHDYLWLGSMSPYLLYQQLKKGYEHGIRRIWILNVGDIKPSEYQTELFMDMAWDIEGVEQQGIYAHLRAFYCRVFGKALGEKIAVVMNEWHRLAFIRKPEHLGGTRVEEKDRTYWSTLRDLPWSDAEILQRLTQYQALSDRVERLFGQIPTVRRDAFFQLVKYPVQGAYQLNLKLLEAQLARHGKGDWARSDAAFDSIQALTLRYNLGFDNHGKWNRMMNWQPRRLPVFGAVPHVDVDSAASLRSAATDDVRCIHHWNGCEAVSGRFIRCEGLGYQQGAVELLPGEVVTYGELSAASTLELHLLPSHPVDGKRLCLWIQVGDAPAQWIDFATQGRNEEWKQNVLRNQAVRTLTIDHPGVLKIWTDCEGVVVDEILHHQTRQRVVISSWDS